jgi:Vitamin K-dependent gamma-carboxylase
VNVVGIYFRDLYRASLAGWNRFWFTPSDPATLGLIRILAGGMLFYTHLVWSLDLESFFGERGWMSPEAVARMQGLTGMWSYFHWIHSTTGLWIVHIAALVVFALLTLGLFSRTMAVLAYLATVSYANRAWSMALFGLDDINALLAMYLAIGPCGAAYSLDRLWKRSRAGRALPIEPSVSANLAIRLIQVHMCVVYFFSGSAKLAGETWWGGQAIWNSIGNLEYQSLDLTWLANWPVLVSAMTHVTVFWELSYCVLVWPRLLRPLVIAMAVPVHLGIAIALGMKTFGLVMLIGNAAFISPAIVRRILDRRPEQGRAGEAHEVEPVVA